ncbi:MAG: cell division protein ZapD [Gammaproteobacteria bacterium]|nr:cell division protein ZapD [Gammaproteobacteria bacterium]
MMSIDSNEELITYEYPLNERIRTLLRLDFLFERAEFGINGDSEWHARTAVDALLDIIDLLTRSDVRAELQKELERQRTTLSKLSGMQTVLEQADSISQALNQAPRGLTAMIRNNAFLTAISQRAGVLGGTCAFDLPGYHLWLQSPTTERQALLKEWLSGFEPIYQGAALVLRLLRNSAESADEVAANGSYNAKLDPATALQMLRVRLDCTHQCFPEISGSRHFCTIRFLRQPSQGERPQQVAEDIPFTLERCVIQSH